ncbi:ankyrin repeat domain-containing protein [bacterium]|nr:ankyrin repeat domain-containing protein [bacterium]
MKLFFSSLFFVIIFIISVSAGPGPWFPIFSLFDQLKHEKKSRYSYTELHLAAINGDADKVKKLIAKGAKVDAIGKEKFGIAEHRVTPLMLAVMAKNHDIARILIDAGANIKAATYSLGLTPIHLAAERGDTSSVKLLLGCNIPVDFLTCSYSKNSRTWDFKETSLMRAVKFHQKDVIFQLLEAGANPNLVNARKENIMNMMFSSYYYYKDKGFEVVSALLEKGIKVPENVLCKSICWNNDKIAELFINHGANVNSCDFSGWTPLHFAAKNNSEKITKILLKKGADPNAKNKKGETPLELARKWEKNDVIFAYTNKRISMKKIFPKKPNIKNSGKMNLHAVGASLNKVLNKNTSETKNDVSGAMVGGKVIDFIKKLKKNP